MQIENAVVPAAAQLQAIADCGVTGPIVMLNLLKFKDRAEYSDPNEPAMTGRQAYDRYGVEVRKLVEAGGGSILFSGAPKALVIGEVGEMWDAVALVRYASPQAFVAMATSPEMAKIAFHRKAGLEGQLLILCTPGGLA